MNGFNASAIGKCVHLSRRCVNPSTAQNTKRPDAAGMLGVLGSEQPAVGTGVQRKYQLRVEVWRLLKPDADESVRCDDARDMWKMTNTCFLLYMETTLEFGRWDCSLDRQQFPQAPWRLRTPFHDTQDASDFDFSK